jgi:sulfonate transport system substrate-binding protein
MGFTNEEVLVNKKSWLKGRRGLLSLFLVILVAWGGVRLIHGPMGDIHEPLESVALGLPLQPSSALVMIALEQGFFQEEGLEVTVTEYPSGKRALRDGLFQEQVEVINVSEPPIVFASFKRTDFQILATIFSADNVNRIIARRDRGIARPTDLAGKQLGTQRASAVHYFLHLFLLEHGLNENMITLSFMKAEKLVDALVRGDIDAFSMREPYISRAADQLGDNAIIFSTPGAYDQMEVLVVNQKLLQRPGVASKLLRGLFRAEAFVQQQPQQSAKIIAKRLGTRPDKIKAILDWTKLRIRLGQGILLQLEDESRWAMQSRLVDQGELPDFHDLINRDELMGVKPEVVTLFH